jgi:dTDP-glucose 4,6-dehydratase
MILELTGKPKSLIKNVADRPGHDRRYALDCAKLRALGWHPHHNFEDAMRQTVHWYQNREDWWRPIVSGDSYRKYSRANYGKR